MMAFHRMDRHAERGQTVYIQDIIPETMKIMLKEPSYNLDKIILHQIKVVSNCKKNLIQKRTHMLSAIENECSKNSNSSCGPFSGEFLTAVMKDVEEDEAEARRKVLGEQESVEMFKTALASDSVSEDHLTAAKAFRDTMTRQLMDVVEAREIVLVALEVLRRSPVAYVPQQHPRLESLGTAYVEAKEAHSKECEILKKLTEWIKKPELHITEEDELFSFFGEDETLDEQENEELLATPELLKHHPSVVKEESNLASALASCEAETQKLLQFKSTKVDAVDAEFNILEDLASDILIQKERLDAALKFIRQACGEKISESYVGIENYTSYLRMKYPKLKFKISTKGYNFSLKAMRRTKSVVSLTLLTSLLDTSQDLPKEVLEAQETFSQLSSAVKRICSKYGRCAMAFQSVITREKELETIIQEAPKVDYAESLRISGNFVANMNEVRRIDALKDDIKKTADRILKEVMAPTGESQLK